MLFLWNQCINIVYPNENYPFVFAPHEEKLDSIHGWSSSRFKDKLWFQTKWTLPMFISRNQHINIMYPNDNYPIIFSSNEKKIYSIHGRSLSCFKGKLWFQTKWWIQMLFWQNQCINIIYPNENYPFVLAPHEKKLDSIHRKSSSCFKDKH